MIVKWLRGYGGQKLWEVMEVEIFRGQIGRQINEVVEFGKFLSLVRSRNLGGREDWKDRGGGSFHRFSHRQ
jgi:hypothetical protein